MRASKLPRDESLHAIAGEGSTSVSQGANRAKNVAPIPNSKGMQGPNSKTAAQERSDRAANAEARSVEKCFYCKRKIKRNEKALACPKGPAQFDFREGEPVCGDCLTFLKSRYRDYSSDCTKRFGRSQ